MPCVTYDKGKIERQKLEIQRIFHVLNRSGPSLSGGDSLDGRALQSPYIDPHNNAATSESENGRGRPCFHQPRWNADGCLTLFLNLDTVAFRRLARCEFASDELPFLIEELFACKDVDENIRHLPLDSAQTFVDVMNEVCCPSAHYHETTLQSGLTQFIEQALDRLDLSLSARVKCLRRLYRTCGCHGILPNALKIPVCYDRTVYPLYQGGYADVWKGEYCGSEVAVKVIRIYSKRDLHKITGVGYRVYSLFCA